jgi:type IV pilus assembly protein PilW
MRMVPFEINPAGIPAGDPNTDVVLVAYGSSENFVTGVPASQPAGPASNFKLYTGENRDGFRAGDLVIAVQPGAGPGGGPSCVMNELTGVPGTGGNCGSPATGGSDVLNHNTGQYKNPNANCQMVTPKYNNAGGIRDANGNVVPALSPPSGTLYDIGALPQIKIFAVRNGNLTTCNWLTQDCTQPANYAVVVDGIVSLRAVYGKDFDGNPNPTSPRGDGVVDSWDRGILDTSNKASRVLAAEVTARSGLKEKPTTGPACDATPTANRPDRGTTSDWYQAFAPGLVAAQIDLSTTSADWSCYRYKLFQTAVPLRNMIWRP